MNITRYTSLRDTTLPFVAPLRRLAVPGVVASSAAPALSAGVILAEPPSRELRRLRLAAPEVFNEKGGPACYWATQPRRVGTPPMKQRASRRLSEVRTERAR